MLDADWNELVELHRPPLRAETVDIIGRGVVPTETPDGSRSRSAGGDARRSAAAACTSTACSPRTTAPAPHGTTRCSGGARHRSRSPYDDQPYCPNAAPSRRCPTDRHAPRLSRRVEARGDRARGPGPRREGGRRRHGDAPADRLAGAPARSADGRRPATRQPHAWDAITAPSAGRLTTAAVGVPRPPTPARSRPPAATAAPRTASTASRSTTRARSGPRPFKWSRDNASIALARRRRSTRRARAHRHPRSAATASAASRVGDWVEVTDDWHELTACRASCARSRPSTRSTRRSRSRPRCPPARSTPPTPTRHTRVHPLGPEPAPRSTPPAASSPCPAAAGTPIVLEDGIQVTLRLRPGRRQLPRRRLLGLRRAHRRRLGRAARRRSRRAASCTTSAGSAVVTFPGTVDRLPDVLAARRRRGGCDCACASASRRSRTRAAR